MSTLFTAKIIRPNRSLPGVFFSILSPKRRYWVCSGEMAFRRDSSGRPFDFVSISPSRFSIAVFCPYIAAEEYICGKMAIPRDYISIQDSSIISRNGRRRVHLRQNGHSPKFRPLLYSLCGKESSLFASRLPDSSIISIERCFYLLTQTNTHNIISRNKN